MLFIHDCLIFQTNLCVVVNCRLKYLLNQSDIFSHFGNGKGGPMPEKSSDKKPDGEKGKRGRRAMRQSGFDEMDEDEQAIAREIGSDEDEAGSSATSSAATVLLAQPSCIAGGAMRYTVIPFIVYVCT